jgi:OOP family OmpA-OmpF porin
MEMISKAVIFVCLFFICVNCLAQDLVNNGSFEQATKCPSYILDFNNVVGWRIFRGTPDYFAACASTGGLGVPRNFNGTRITFFGDAYAGLSLLGKSGYFGDKINYLADESIYTRTTRTLQTGKNYELSFWISLADSSRFSTEELYCSFSEKAPVKAKSLDRVVGNRVVGLWNKFDSCDDFACNIDFEIKGMWNKVTLKFTAKNRYNYLAIGLPRNCYSESQYLVDLTTFKASNG